MKFNYIIKRLTGALFLLILFIPTQAQTAIFNQQWYSRVNRNPAAAASGIEALNLGLFYNAQWVGFDGAPTTTLLNADTYFGKINSGFGLTISYDQIGKSQSNFNALFSYAYLIRLNDEWKLSLGLAGGLMNMNNDPTKNTFAGNDATSIPNYKVNEFSPDFNAGAEASFRQLTFGFAVDHLLYGDAGDFDSPKTPREFYAYGHYNFILPEQFEIAPQAAWNYTNAYGESIFSIGATANYRRLVTLGVNWKIDNAIAFMGGVEFSGIQLGYAYQLSVGDVSNLSRNTHELMLRIRINHK